MLLCTCVLNYTVTQLNIHTHTHTHTCTCVQTPVPPPPPLQSLSSSDDWRQELLKAVERIIEHEHGMLVSMATARGEGEEASESSFHQSVQDQVCNDHW